MRLFKRDLVAEAADPKMVPPAICLSVATIGLPPNMPLPEYGDVVTLLVTFKVTEDTIRDTWDGKNSQRRVMLEPQAARLPVYTEAPTPTEFTD